MVELLRKEDEKQARLAEIEAEKRARILEIETEIHPELSTLNVPKKPSSSAR